MVGLPTGEGAGGACCGRLGARATGAWGRVSAPCWRLPAHNAARVGGCHAALHRSPQHSARVRSTRRAACLVSRAAAPHIRLAGVGALLLRRAAAPALHVTYWGGGSVLDATAEGGWRMLMPFPEGLETGTMPFLDIITLKHGFALLNGPLGGMHVRGRRAGRVTERHEGRAAMGRVLTVCRRGVGGRQGLVAPAAQRQDSAAHPPAPGAAHKPGPPSQRTDHRRSTHMLRLCASGPGASCRRCATPTARRCCAFLATTRAGPTCKAGFFSLWCWPPTAARTAHRRCRTMRARRGCTCAAGATAILGSACTTWESGPRRCEGGGGQHRPGEGWGRHGHESGAPRHGSSSARPRQGARFAPGAWQQLTPAPLRVVPRTGA